MRGKITKRRIGTLGPGDILADDEIRGFVARRLESGVVTYGYRYRHKATGRQRWLGLGIHGSITPDQARVLARKAAGEVADRRDPVGERQKERSIVTRRITVGSLVPTYLYDRQHAFKPATYKAQTRYLDRCWLPLHEHAIGDVQRTDVVVIVDTIARKQGRVAADRARTSLSAFFSWAIDRGHCDLNPTRNIARRAPAASRMRVLEEGELATIWNACEPTHTVGEDADYSRIVRLLILTGQRKSEIGDLFWSEVDIQKRQLELPSQRVKNNRAHVVPLSDEALAIIRSISRRDGRDLMFGNGEGGFSGWSRAKTRLDQRLAREMPSWTIHDIRRSVVTHLHELGFALPHIVEAIVNHISGHRAGVAGIYNKAVYLAERRRALDMWGAHIAALGNAEADSSAKS